MISGAWPEPVAGGLSQLMRRVGSRPMADRRNAATDV
jgi:hypothetical protein